jgi:hypothetical protein
MKGKTMNGMDDNRNTRQFGSQPAQESGLGVVGVDNVVKIAPEESGQIQEGQSVLKGMQGLNHVLEWSYLHMVFLYKWDQSSPRRTCQFHLIEVPVHPLHAQKSIDAGSAYYGQGVYV